MDNFADKLGTALGGKGAAMPPAADDDAAAEAGEDYKPDTAETAAASNLQEALTSGTAEEVAEAFKKMMEVCG